MSRHIHVCNFGFMLLTAPQIVDEYSSRVHASLEEPLPVLSADHNSMVKFVDKDDSTFVRISRIIQRVEKIPSKAETGSMCM